MPFTTSRTRDDIEVHGHTGPYDGGLLRQSALLNDSGTPLSAPDLPHVLLDGSTHPDTVAAGVSRGSLIYGNATPKWAELLIGPAVSIPQSDGADISWVGLSGDATLAVGGALTLATVLTAGGPTGSATVVPIITWDAKGRLTAVSSAAITYPDYSTVYQPIGSYAATARIISAGAGLTGGGDLSADRTIALTAPVVTASGGTGLTAAGTLGNVLTSDGSIWTSAAPAATVVDAARTWSTLQKFPDDKLRVVGSADATKMAAFEVDGFDTATTRTFTLPDDDCTLAHINGAAATQVWTSFNEVDTDIGTFNYKGSAGNTIMSYAAPSGFSVSIGTPASMTGDSLLIIPNNAGVTDIATTGAAQSLFKKTLSGVDNYIRCGTSHTRFAKLSSTTVYFTIDAGALTGVRNLAVPDASGMLMVPETVVTHTNPLTNDIDIVTHNGEVVTR